MRSLASAIFFASLLSCAGGPARVRIEPYLGVDPCLFLEAPDAKVAAIVMPEIAGRIVHYSLEGENILWENNDSSGKPRPGGGYQVDLGPEMRIIPPHPVLWSGKYGWAGGPGATVTVASEPDPVLGMKVEKQITLDPASGTLRIAQRMRNVSAREQSFCLWDRTLCRGKGFAIIPLNPKSRFSAWWVIGKRKGGAWEYNGKDPAHLQIRILEGVLVAQSGGPEQKIGADADAGWIAYAHGRLLFVKYYAYVPDGNYTDGGLSVACYFNDRFTELEPLSPEVPLRPGGEYVFPEEWTLVRLGDPVASHEQARALVARIPPSPFRR